MEKISFEKYKDILWKYNYEFYMERNIEMNNYKEENLKSYQDSYNENILLLNDKININKKQYYFYLENYICACFENGALSSHFMLNTNYYMYTICDNRFSICGEIRAYFEKWQQIYKRLYYYKKIKNNITLIGSVLGIILSVIKSIEIFK